MISAIFIEAKIDCVFFGKNFKRIFYGVSPVGDKSKGKSGDHDHGAGAPAE